MCWDKIGLIVFDKLLIGLILLGAAFLTKWLLERSKMTFGFALKFSEERIRRIGEIWTEIDECEALLRNFQRIIQTAEKTDKSDRTTLTKLGNQAKSVGKQVGEKYTAVRMKIDSNRFWLGDDSVYQSFVSHAVLLYRHLTAFTERGQKGLIPVKTIDEEIRASRKTIVNYLKLP